MDEFESLRRTKWECKYRVVFIPRYRRHCPSSSDATWARSFAGWRCRTRAGSKRGTRCRITCT